MDHPHHQLKQQAQKEEGRAEKTAPHTPATATKPVRHYRAYLFQLYVLGAIVAFGVLAFLARNTPYFSIDLTIERALQTIRWTPFDLLMQFLTNIGYAPLSYLWCGAIILVLFLIGLRWEAVVALVSVLGIVLLGMVIKELVQRARPAADLVNVFSAISEFSFPSGHVLFYVGFLGFLGFLIYTLGPHSWLRTVGLIIIAVMIALIGVARVYLGQHWPSDVLGAYLLGSAWLALMIFLYRWGKPRFFVHQPAAPEQPTQDKVRQ